MIDEHDHSGDCFLLVLRGFRCVFYLHNFCYFEAGWTQRKCAKRTPGRLAAVGVVVSGRLASMFLCQCLHNFQTKAWNNYLQEKKKS
jgi:hypothetical protein